MQNKHQFIVKRFEEMNFVKSLIKSVTSMNCFIIMNGIWSLTKLSKQNKKGMFIIREVNDLQHVFRKLI